MSDILDQRFCVSKDLKEVDCFTAEISENGICWIANLKNGEDIKLTEEEKDLPDLFKLFYQKSNKSIQKSFFEDFIQVNNFVYVNASSLSDFYYIPEKKDKSVMRVCANFKEGNNVFLYAVKNEDLLNEIKRNNRVLELKNCCVDVRYF